uniref:Uncharacterized protein n=1 Tax=Triticum urartu TaxID=4572 RepID=A0A8R7QTQ9_TRIUA
GPCLGDRLRPSASSAPKNASTAPPHRLNRPHPPHDCCWRSSSDPATPDAPKLSMGPHVPTQCWSPGSRRHRRR